MPGANLYYEVRGAGPVLLLVCGGVYDADGYAGLARLLADRYTVVTYDRRGNSRSPLDGPPEHQSIEVPADAGYLIVDVPTEQRALDIAARWPDARFGAMEVREILDEAGIET